MAPEYFPDHSPEHVGGRYTQMVKKITQKSIVKKTMVGDGVERCTKLNYSTISELLTCVTP